jgi:hypothetical protein
MMTAASEVQRVSPLRPPREWWVIDTPVGPKAVDYRPNTRTGAVGPFCGPDTAAMKVDERRGRTERRRHVTRVCSFLAGLVLALVGAAVLLS